MGNMQGNDKNNRRHYSDRLFWPNSFIILGPTLLIYGFIGSFVQKPIPPLYCWTLLLNFTVQWITISLLFPLMPQAWWEQTFKFESVQHDLRPGRHFHTLTSLVYLTFFFFYSQS